jgi:hypothetical protein
MGSKITLTMYAFFHKWPYKEAPNVGVSRAYSLSDVTSQFEVSIIVGGVKNKDRVRARPQDATDKLAQRCRGRSL